ncbi:hypothetical protein ACWCOV_20410 [Kribbella sp. NPDC002412]
MLFLADASGLLGEGPTYTETSAGPARDLAAYYVAYLELSSRLGILAYAGAVALVGVALTAVLPLDTAYNVLALASGALLGPALAIWLGREVARHAATAQLAAEQA